MADISDITAYLKAQALAAVYPNGTSQPSVANMDVAIMEGWPLANALENDIRGLMVDPSDPTQSRTISRPGGPRANVSIFPTAGSPMVYQILNKTYTITPAAINMTFTLSNDVITVSGEPAVGEYLTVIADDSHVYSRSGSTAAEILYSIAGDAQADYPEASSTATTLTIPGTFSLVVRQGGVATLGRVINRQKHCVMVTVWAPTQSARTALAKAIDNVIKQTIKPTMPDTSQAIITYARTYVADDQQTVTIYRRDLVYDAEFATVEQFPGYVITSTQVSIANPSNTAIATATT